MSSNEIFKALSDPTRRKILRLLRDRGRTAGEIAEEFDLAKSTLSGHFNVLKQANLVIAERKRTTVYYQLNISVLEETFAAVLDLFSNSKGSDNEKTV